MRTYTVDDLTTFSKIPSPDANSLEPQGAWEFLLETGHIAQVTRGSRIACVIGPPPQFNSPLPIPYIATLANEMMGDIHQGDFPIQEKFAVLQIENKDRAEANPNHLLINKENFKERMRSRKVTIPKKTSVKTQEKTDEFYAIIPKKWMGNGFRADKDSTIFLREGKLTLSQQGSRSVSFLGISKGESAFFDLDESQELKKICAKHFFNSTDYDDIKKNLGENFDPNEMLKHMEKQKNVELSMSVANMLDYGDINTRNFYRRQQNLPIAEKKAPLPWSKTNRGFELLEPPRYEAWKSNENKKRAKNYVDSNKKMTNYFLRKYGFSKMPTGETLEKLKVKVHLDVLQEISPLHIQFQGEGAKAFDQKSSSDHKSSRPSANQNDSGQSQPSTLQERIALVLRGRKPTHREPLTRS